ncbi:trypsin-like serine peptidase [Nonomuraea insulae]|uniref:Trypsin-like serine peptidase n=1 Tax=Nonomuraea insulae TaxID=1616787 RepID=A0ABW1CHE6_9ACTN
MKIKHTLVPLGGGLAAAALLSASFAGTAQAQSHVKPSESVSTTTAQGIASFWLQNNGAALQAATYLEEDTTDVDKLKTTGTATTDTKAGAVAPTGTTTSSSKSKNVNLPKTVGKVFFVDQDGKNRWCSASSIQGKYANVVATAGHCVYDTANDEQLMDNWVFVPGYYQGKAPWGIYVGKQAFVHYDYSVYEDYDRDYGFVSVYNGVTVKDSTVTRSEYDSDRSKRRSDDTKGDLSYYDRSSNKYHVVEVADAGRLGDNVGGQGISWNQPLKKAHYVFGYPQAAHPDGNKPYTGVTPKWCYGTTTAKTVGSAAKKIEEHVGLKCAMTAGADGGPWLLKYSSSKRTGYLNGVTSSFYDQDENDRVDYISSPYFDAETYSVYTSAAAVWSGKLF